MTSPTVVRSARSADRDVLATTKIASWTSTYAALVPHLVLTSFIDPARQLDAFERLLADPSQRVLVAEDVDRVVGFITCEPAHADGPYVDSLHIAPDRRSTGIGRRLLVAVAASLVTEGFDTLHLHVLEGNARARWFYEQLGGRLAGRGAAEWAPDDVIEVTYRWDDLGSLSRV